MSHLIQDLFSCLNTITIHRCFSLWSSIHVPLLNENDLMLVSKLDPHFVLCDFSHSPHNLSLFQGIKEDKVSNSATLHSLPHATHFQTLSRKENILLGEPMHILKHDVTCMNPTLQGDALSSTYNPIQACE